MIQYIRYFCVVMSMPICAAIVWDNTTNISGVFTQDITIVAGTDTTISGDTTIQADGVNITVTVDGNTALSSANNEQLLFETKNGGNITLLFNPGAQLTLRNTITMRIPEAVSINLGNDGNLIAKDQSRIDFA